MQCLRPQWISGRAAAHVRGPGVESQLSGRMSAVKLVPNQSHTSLCCDPEQGAAVFVWGELVVIPISEKIGNSLMFSRFKNPFYSLTLTDSNNYFTKIKADFHPLWCCVTYI